MDRSDDSTRVRRRGAFGRLRGRGFGWGRGEVSALEPVDSGIGSGWFEALVEHASDAMVGVDADQRIRVWNAAAAEMFGYRDVEIIGGSLSTLLPEGVRRGHDDLVRSFGAGGRDRRAMGQGTELRALRRDGSEFPVEIAIAKIPLGDEIMLMASVRDVSAKREVEQALAARNTELASVLTAIPDSVCRLTADGTFVEVVAGSDGGVPLTAEVVGQNIAAVLPEGLAGRCMQAINTVMGSEEVVALEFCESDFGLEGNRSFESRHARLGEDQVIAIIRDVTARKQAEEELAHLAMHDALTGLANRRLLLDRLDQALRRSARTGGVVALLYLDLDHFKAVNDRLGHDAGDRLLMSVAERLTAAARAGDTVARLGGDEFAVLVEGLDDIDAVFSVAERLADDLRTPVQLGRHEARVTASIGLVTAHDGDGHAITMLGHADTAMYHAKDHGRDRIAAFDDAVQAALEHRLDTEAALRDALDHDQFEIHYQPVVDLVSGTIVGVEALLRWDRPGHGPISPAEFIPVAEDAGLIDELGEWVLRRACAQAVDWQHRHPTLLHMAVNVSARQLVDPGLAASVSEVIAETGIDPTALTIEVTETAVIEQGDIAIANLNTLREQGVSIALDDFGTGYSSLTYLRDLPISHIKIDRSFTAGLTTDPNDAAIIESTIALAQRLGLAVIAEGVETADQLELLTHYRCDQAQGYYLGHPQPAADIDQLLQASLSTNAT
jgi:diguanylate cyclase (GGDEF)-like protein/PAS domain S-box-containing protein